MRAAGVGCCSIPTSSTSTTRFGYYGILGLSFGGKLYIEVTYRSVEATVTGIDIPDFEFDPELIEGVAIDLTGWGANVGFRW